MTVSHDIGGGPPLDVSQWDTLELKGADAEELRERQLQAQLDHASFYRQCFTTEAGRFVLAELIELYVKQRIVDPEQTEVHAAIRQGGHDVVTRILQVIEFANTGGDPTQE